MGVYNLKEEEEKLFVSIFDRSNNAQKFKRSLIQSPQQKPKMAGVVDMTFSST